MTGEPRDTRHSTLILICLVAGLLLIYLIVPVPFIWLGYRVGMTPKQVETLFAPQISLAEHWHFYSAWLEWQSRFFKWQ